MRGVCLFGSRFVGRGVYWRKEILDFLFLGWSRLSRRLVWGFGFFLVFFLWRGVGWVGVGVDSWV